MITTIGDVCQAHADRMPDRTAVIFLDHDGDEERTARLTCAGLDRRARAIAAHLRDRFRPGDRVVLTHTPGLAAIEALFGCFYAGLVSVPLPASRSERAGARTAAVIRDSGARAVLCTGAQRTRAVPNAHQPPDGPDAIATDTIPDADADRYRPAALDAGGLAYLQYTSGSSGVPKGVMISHAALLSNLEQIREAFDHTASHVCVNWLPLHHDMGLVGALLQPLYVGFLAILMSPAAFIQRPERWLRAITRYGGTSCGGPNFAYQLCVDRIPTEVRRTLDLRTWRIAFCGAEPIHPDTVRRFIDAYAPCGFRPASLFPCYGLAEATLFVTSVRVDTPPVIRAFDAVALERDEVLPAPAGHPGARELVGCGYPRGDTEVIVADVDGRPLPPGRIGEILVRGPALGAGYWGRPDLDRGTFESTSTESGEARQLRTGDTGFMHDGQLFVTGRLKDLIIVDGRNIASHDLEWLAETSDDRVREAVAFGVPRLGSERPVVLVGVGKTWDASVLREIGDNVRRGIGYTADVALDALAIVRASALARTTSGKLARVACRLAYVEGRLDVLAYWRARGGWSEASDSTRSGMAAQWLGGVRRAEPRVRLFCFGHAGARAEAFASWALRLPEAIDVCPVQLPGRGARASEPPCRRMSILLDDLQELVSRHLDRPYALFGHCIGGRIAFELASRFARVRLPLPKQLFLAAIGALDTLPDADRDSYRLPPEAFEAYVIAFGGLPPGLRARPDTLQRVLELIRADLELTGTLRPGAPAPLACPLVVFGGRQDPRVTEAQLESWRPHTTAGCSLHWLDGGHFFLEERGDEVLALIASYLLDPAERLTTTLEARHADH